ncbi:MgtC/SapB family protein [Catenulispora yoronensis]
MHAVGAVLLAAAQQSENIKIPTHWDAVGRIALAWVLTFALGFERQLRGAMAGDRTFSLLGAATALIGVLAGNGASTILAGAVTGIGFIGGGLCFRQTVEDHEVLHGITTAASIFACAAIGAACGLGLIKESIAATVATLLTLELRHIPVLRILDARRWTGLLLLDDHIHEHFFRKTHTEAEVAAYDAERVAGREAAEARVATAATADTDAVVLINPVIAAQQAARRAPRRSSR